MKIAVVGSGISGLVAARLVLDPALPVKPGIVAIPSGCDSELATALSAHAITLAPGEMVVEIGEGGVMYTHALDATLASEYVDEAQRLRLDLLRKVAADIGRHIAIMIDTRGIEIRTRTLTGGKTDLEPGDVDDQEFIIGLMHDPALPLQIDPDLGDALELLDARASHRAVHVVPLLDEELGEVGAVLPGNSRD